MTAGALAAGALRTGVRRRVATLNIQGKGMQEAVDGASAGIGTSLFLHSRLLLYYARTGLVPYASAWQLQQKLVAQRIAWQKEERYVPPSPPSPPPLPPFCSPTLDVSLTLPPSLPLFQTWVRRHAGA